MQALNDAPQPYIQHRAAARPPKNCPRKGELFWRGEAVQPGMYFIRLTTDRIFRAKRTVVLVR